MLNLHLLLTADNPRTRGQKRKYVRRVKEAVPLFAVLVFVADKKYTVAASDFTVSILFIFLFLSQCFYCRIRDADTISLRRLFWPTTTGRTTGDYNNTG